MELTVSELENKVKALKADNQEFLNKTRSELESADKQLQGVQKALQERAQQAQRDIDVREGKVKALEDLIKEMGGSTDQPDNVLVPDETQAPTPAS